MFFSGAPETWAGAGLGVADRSARVLACARDLPSRTGAGRRCKGRDCPVPGVTIETGYERLYFVEQLPPLGHRERTVHADRGAQSRESFAFVVFEGEDGSRVMAYGPRMDSWTSMPPPTGGGVILDHSSFLTTIEPPVALPLCRLTSENRHVTKVGTRFDLRDVLGTNHTVPPRFQISGSLRAECAFPTRHRCGDQGTFLQGSRPPHDSRPLQTKVPPRRCGCRRRPPGRCERC